MYPPKTRTGSSSSQKLNASDLNSRSENPSIELIAEFRLQRSFKKILICDDHPICQLGIEFYFRNLLTDFLEVIKADSGQQMLELFKRHEPDLLVLDLMLPDVSGLQLLQALPDCTGKTQILVITSCDDPIVLRQVLEAKIDVLLWKSHSVETFKEALLHLRNSAPTTKYIDPAIARALEQPTTDILTKREWEVLALIAKGLTNESIAKNLGCSIETVKTHRANLGIKTSSRNRAELTAWYLQGNGKAHASAFFKG